MMTQALLSVVAFVVVLALLPWGIKWVQRRAAAGGVAGTGHAGSRIVAAVAVGPQQRVMTIEVGPESARTWIVVGVTPQAITALHTLPAPVSAPVPPPATDFAHAAASARLQPPDGSGPGATGYPRG